LRISSSKVDGRSQWSAMVVSYRFSIVTIALPITIRPQFAVECLLRSNQQGWVIFEPNLGRKGLTDVNQILTRSRRDMVQSYAKEILPISSAV